MGLAAMLLLSGCGTVPVVTDLAPERITAMCGVERDDFAKVTRVVSPRIGFADPSVVPGEFNAYYQFTAARRDGETNIHYFLEVLTRSGTWAFWEYAYDRSGRRFDFPSPRRDLDDTYAIVTEVCAAPLPRDYLDQVALVGTEWKVYGLRATKRFGIPPNLASGFLARCDKQFGAR